MCQRGPGFDLGGLRLPLPQFPRPEDQKEINEYFSHNKFTILFPTYSSDIDREVLAAVEAFFSIPPISDFKDHFNIYSVAVSSVSSDYSPGSVTAFGCWYGEGTTVGGNDYRCRDYTVDVVSKERIDDAVTVVLMNSERYGGTSYLYAPFSGKYGSGWAVSYIPLCSDPVDFTFLVRNEALGHAFAKLAHENSYETNGHIPSSLISEIKDKEKYGWWSNIDFTSDPSAVKWAKFIEDERYSSERVDVYKGGWGYWTGIWTPSYEAFVEYDLGATGQ